MYVLKVDLIEDSHKVNWQIIDLCFGFSICHLFFIVPITSEAFIIPWDGALYPTLIPICALCRQVSCYNSIQLHIIFSSVTSKNLFQVDDKLPDITTIFMCPSVTKTLRYKK